MQRDKLLILAIFVVVVAAAIGFRRYGAFRNGGGAVEQIPLRGGPPLKPVDVAQLRGFSLQLQSSYVYHPYEKYIEEIADTGANAVNFVLAAYQENCGSTSIFVEARKIPSDERLIKLVALARKKGLRVVLMPIVLLENPKAGEWRGKINPANWDDWWKDYNEYILHYAKVGQIAGVELLVVGSELVSTEKDHAGRWRSLIRQVRQRFNGYLSYSANWDHYRPVTWWRDVDIIGMTTYYDLTEGKEPTVERLMASWRPIRQEILEWQRTIGRPILFTEVGWPNQTTCAQYPWDYTRSPDKPDTTAQANCFEAFFRTWIQRPETAGFLVWEWRNHPEQGTGPEDPGYVPCGKPALETIKKHYQAPDPRGPKVTPAPTAPTTAVSAPTRPTTTDTKTTTAASPSP